MNGFPDSVHRIVEKATERYPNDIKAATTQAENQIRKLTEFPEIVDSLIRKAVQELVYQHRCDSNRQLKRESGAYFNMPKVLTTRSEGVLKAARTHFDHFIAGKRLGSVLGKELSEIANSEQAVGEGHLFNSRLAQLLIPIVPPESTVDSLSKKKLDSIWKQAKRESKQYAA